MMRALLFLSLVGAAIYGFMVVVGDGLSGGTPKDGLAIQTQPNHTADEGPSSWGSHLPSRPSNQKPQSPSSQKFAASSQGGGEPSQNSGRDQMAAPGSGATSSDRDGAKAASSIVSPPPIQVDEGSVAEPPTSKRTARKSAKRSPSAKRQVVNADPGNDRWARRAERRRGLGLFMFRQAPRFAGNGR